MVESIYYHDNVLYTVSAPWTLSTTIKSIVGHKSIAVIDSDLELHTVKLSFILSAVRAQILCPTPELEEMLLREGACMLLLQLNLSTIYYYITFFKTLISNFKLKKLVP